MTSRSFIFSLLLVVAPVASAQPTFPLRDESARMEQVGNGTYAIIHDDATDEWPHGNTGVVVGEQSVLVVDATYLPSRARADIALIRAVTDKPIRYLAYTHWHFDQLLEVTTARVAAMAKEGRSLDEIQTELDLSDVRACVPEWSGNERDEDWQATTRALIERAWRGVRGQGG